MSASAPTSAPPEPWTHVFLDALAFEWHCEMAEATRREPALLAIPRENLARWLARGDFDEGERASLCEWEPLLDELRMDDLVAAMTDSGERGQRMRQSTPFAGVLPRSGREAILQRKIDDWQRHAKDAVA